MGRQSKSAPVTLKWNERKKRKKRPNILYVHMWKSHDFDGVEIFLICVSIRFYFFASSSSSSSSFCAVRRPNTRYILLSNYSQLATRLLHAWQIINECDGKQITTTEILFKIMTWSISCIAIEQKYSKWNWFSIGPSYNLQWCIDIVFIKLLNLKLRLFSRSNPCNSIEIVWIQRCDDRYKQFRVIFICSYLWIPKCSWYSWDEWAIIEKIEIVNKNKKFIAFEIRKQSKDRNLFWSVEQINHFVNGKRERDRCLVHFGWSSGYVCMISLVCMCTLCI